MKARYIIIPLVIIILIIAGFFIYRMWYNANPIHPSSYTRTLQSQLNPSDFHTPGGQSKETAEVYLDNNSTYYRVNILEYSDTSSAENGITKLKNQYNPGMIVMGGKYVNYKELSPGSNYYFYQSGKNIITMDSSGDKNLGDNFIIWYYSKYPAI